MFRRSSVVARTYGDRSGARLARSAAIEALGPDQGYDVIIASSRGDRAIETSRLNAELAWRPAGVIAIPCSDVIPDALTTACREVPVLFLDRMIPAEARADTIDLDNVIVNYRCDEGEDGR